MNAYLQGISKLSKWQKHRIAAFAIHAKIYRDSQPNTSIRYKARISGYLLALEDLGILNDDNYSAINDRAHDFVRR